MKRPALNQVVIFLLLVLTPSISMFAQPRMTSETRGAIKLILEEYKISQGQSVRWNDLSGQFPIYKTGGGYVVSFLAKKNAQFDPAEFINHHMIIGSKIGEVVTLRVPVNELLSLNTIVGLEYICIAGKVAPDLDRSLYDTRVDSVHKGINLPQSYTGLNVMIGVADWGFDYTSPMFYDTLLTQTRIHAAWDQFKTSGPAPSGFTYGAEYNGATELLLAQTDTTNFYGHHTHGTHVAGIAGGSGAGTKYRGMAFEAEFLMVTRLIDEAAILDAFNWMKTKADAAGKRLVINMSFGGYYGGSKTLDGNSLTSLAMDVLSSQGVVFCGSAGNNGGTQFHIQKTFAADTLKSRVGFYTYADTTNWGQNIPMWGQVNHSFQSKIQLLNASNIVVAESPMFNTAIDTNYVDSFITVGVDTVWYTMAADDAHPSNLRPYMDFRIQNKTSYKTLFVSYADSGVVHYWNVTEFNWGSGNWGQSFISLGPGYTAGNDEFAVAEPGVTSSIITVAAHYPEFLNGLGNLVGGQVCSFTSKGPRIDGSMKPDVSGPGGNICSSISSFTTSAYTPVTSIVFNSRTYPFARFSGTSMSSPATAGVAALILQADPLLTSQEVKDIIMTTAREDSHTGDIPDSGSTQWGQGKLNAYFAIATTLNVVGLNTYSDQKRMIYPNPASDQIFILSDQNEMTLYQLNIFSVEGKCMKTINYQWNTPVDISFLPDGIYFLRLSAGTESYQAKFVKTAN